ncbi:hypothetical protein BV898_18829 [Hypsibius exemplaris]|uniref:HIT-type domain-containing protein n=1 Tax=Hypsibius exemplaris TaxID=2072580 RepID=A0A9X6RNW4_HYPEX|nr:hypothetical protein BV898_18829 [Hypsibius exemplaris]
MAVQEVAYKSAEIEIKKYRDRVNAEAHRAHLRRQRLETLQQDNHFEDPHKNLVMAKNIPTFCDESERKQAKKPRKGKLAERWRKTYAQAFVEEDRYWQSINQSALDAAAVCNYITAEAGKSRLPAMHFCSVCSCPCCMKCVTCEDRFCSKRCLEIHKDTRCMKRVM